MNPKGYVVVLEKDPLILALIERWLGEAGFEMEPLGPRSDSKPALVIVDVPAPKSAEPIVRSLREYAAPILVTSARFRRGLAGSAEAATRLGASKVLPKPFSREEFLLAVHESIRDIP